MADSAFVIVSGDITHIDTRNGVKDGNPWSMSTAHVLVAKRGMCEVLVPRDLSVTGGEIPVIGSTVNWLVRLEASRFGLQGSVVGLAPDPLDALTAPDTAATFGAHVDADAFAQ
jgi:hypothetical protein